MVIDSRVEPYRFGEELRERVTYVTATGLRAGSPTPRMVAGAAPKPLSQYPLGSAVPGYRLEHTERGHIIGLQFGGPEDPRNLVPMYADFNGGGGLWGRLEADVQRWLQENRHRSLGMSVSINYPDVEAAIPTSFGVSFHSASEPLPFDRFGGFRFHIHPPAHIPCDDLDEDDLTILDRLKSAQRRMMDRRWLVETSGHITIAGSGRSMRSGVTDIPVAVGAVDVARFDLHDVEQVMVVYLCRPYAVLDYLWFETPEEYRRLGFAPPGRFDNTQPFSEAQKSAIRKVNILAHLGYMVSDLRHSSAEPYDTLYIGSADASAQVDHIAGRAGAGSNCFSNARLVSKRMNLALNQAIVKDEANAIYAEPRHWPSLAADLRAFWCGGL